MELYDLPVDALNNVLVHLSYKDLLSVGATCRSFHQLANADDVWLFRCKPWAEEVQIGAWLGKMGSAKAVFRLLNELSALVGSWCAQELGPRGGLLYITWGLCSVIACRVIPEWQGTSPGLLCMRLFEVVGERGGACRVLLLTGRGLQEEVALPGALLWTDDCKSAFCLETVAPPARPLSASEAEGGSAAARGEEPLSEEAEAARVALREDQRGVRDDLFLRQLLRNMWLSHEHHHLVLPLPGNPGEGPPHLAPARAAAAAPAGGVPPNNDNMRQRAVQYLIRLATLGHNRAEPDRFLRQRRMRNNGDAGGSSTSSSARIPRLRHGSGSSGGGSGSVGEDTLAALTDPYGQGSGGSASGSGSGAGSGPEPFAERRIEVPASRYSKLSVARCRPGQELAGLWCGMYGPHGLEILNVEYTDDGQLSATKILGDPNVPCGEVSFKVNLNTESREDLQQMQALAASVLGNHGDAHNPRFDFPELVKIYKGYGRVAGYNFRYPQWVPGQLLVERGGRIAFLWEDVNFIIRFERLSLPTLVQQQLPPSAAEAI